MNATVKRTVVLVLALAKLHNYCIEGQGGQSDLTSSTANDEWNMELNGSVPLVPATTSALSRGSSVAKRDTNDDTIAEVRMYLYHASGCSCKSSFATSHDQHHYLADGS